jgi:hypothetical protein
MCPNLTFFELKYMSDFLTPSWIEHLMWLRSRNFGFTLDYLHTDARGYQLNSDLWSLDSLRLEGDTPDKLTEFLSPLRTV